MVKLVCGVGINDADYVVQPTINGVRVCCPYYRAWKNMIVRCYDKKKQESQPTYKGCSVADEWLTLSNFYSWMRDQDWNGKYLDKDILVHGNKVYSPETCVFVDNITNCFMNEQPNARGSLPLGVHLKSGKIAASCRNPFTGNAIWLGYFKSKEEAHFAWLEKKRELAIAVAANQDDERVSNAILNRYK